MKILYQLYLAIVLLILVSCHKEKQSIVARVNNEAITISEMKHWMLLEKANVYNYFYRKYKVEDSKAFWAHMYGGEIPLEKLKRIAFQQAKRCKIQQIIALEKGIIETATFVEILMELEKVNSERKKKVANGDPIFGPVQFTSRSYFSHVFDQMVIKLKNELAKNELKPSEDEVKLMQTRTRQASNNNVGILSMYYVDIHYEAYIEHLVNSARIEIIEDVYDKLNLD